MAVLLSDLQVVPVWQSQPAFAASGGIAGRALLIAAAVLGSVIALGFAWVGAWLVLPFTGLELFALWLALRHVARAAQDFEEIRLQADRLRVTTRIGGQTSCLEFHPYWVQLQLLSTPEAPRPRLVIRSHGREIEIGHHLDTAQKSALARDLRARLATLRANPSNKEDS